MTAMERHETFLGGTHEMGIAFTIPDYEPHMACYQCASTMGYKSPKTWSGEQRADYNADYDHALRGQNFCACAENEARLQSMRLNILNGFPTRQ